jgi:dodecin
LFANSLLLRCTRQRRPKRILRREELRLLSLVEPIARAVKTLKNVEGAWAKPQKVVVKNGRIAEYRVDLKVTFILID